MICTDTLKWNTFPNFGYITEKLPENLFAKIKEECELARKTRYNLTTNKKEEMISGLSGSGVTKHYYLTECRKELNDYTIELFKTYEYVFHILKSFKQNNKNLDITTTPPWINIQEKGEFIPAHNHDGIVAYVIWVKIPFNTEDERPNGEGSASTFSFTYNNTVGSIMHNLIPVSKDYEGTIMMFPSSLTHQVYPFYTSDDVRISVSGMICFDSDKVIPTEQQQKHYK